MLSAAGDNKRSKIIKDNKHGHLLVYYRSPTWNTSSSVKHCQIVYSNTGDNQQTDFGNDTSNTIITIASVKKECIDTSDGYLRHNRAVENIISAPRVYWQRVRMHI